MGSRWGNKIIYAYFINDVSVFVMNIYIHTHIYMYA